MSLKQAKAFAKAQRYYDYGMPPEIPEDDGDDEHEPGDEPDYWDCNDDAVDANG